jgi:hypothetical protein
MKASTRLLLGISMAIALPGTAWATSSVIVGNATYYCQHSCVVSTNPWSGALQVSDLGDGWVLKKVNTGPIPVPQIITPHPTTK